MLDYLSQCEQILRNLYLYWSRYVHIPMLKSLGMYFTVHFLLSLAFWSDKEKSLEWLIAQCLEQGIVPVTHVMQSLFSSISKVDYVLLVCGLNSLFFIREFLWQRKSYKTLSNLHLPIKNNKTRKSFLALKFYGAIILELWQERLGMSWTLTTRRMPIGKIKYIFNRRAMWSHVMIFFFLFVGRCLEVSRDSQETKP